MAERTNNGYQLYLHDFLQEDVLIVCPRCKAMGRVKALGAIAGEASRRAVCTHCGYNKTLEEMPAPVLYCSAKGPVTGRVYMMGGGIDPYFHLPLWLQAQVNGQLLWAYHHTHLDFLEAHIFASLRERNGQEPANRSLGSRLPKWMLARENRAPILKAIERLRQKR
ncbi:hypothetical protein [Phaeodactylibacter luteus]|uniref:TFIIB-type zinc ribbon-containing protein n=1 Tax=Phaeodactylibacter luteus TaxID=1564516 RepID=A0A5C6RQL5_9BACT|nr:hypothetical protein [Phaeodactylibacter luteus]TXB64467.1 hypothetical protein FRY97_07145 [Phaeodactylibacter luteus]